MAAVSLNAAPQNMGAIEYPLDWNGPVERPFEVFSELDKARPIVELLRQVVLRYPDRVALLEGDETMTYGELWSEVATWSSRIEASTSPGELVAIIGRASIPVPVAMLACLAAGCPFVAIDPQLPREWIARTLKSARPALLLTEKKGCLTITSSRNSSSDSALPSSPRQPCRMTVDSPAIVLYTSGSSGDPKGIVNSQRNLLQRVAQSINSAHINCEDRLLTLAPLSTIVGVRDVLTALLAGASILLLDVGSFAAADVLRLVRSNRITILFSFPALLRALIQNSDRTDAESVRLIRIGGDSIHLSDIESLRAWLPANAHVQSIYAATEAPMMQWFVPDNVRSNDGRISIGYPLPENELTIIGDDGLPARNGEAGELIVRSPYVALGVWSDGQCKPENVRLDPINSRLRVWKTGDLVRRQADGFFVRLGRIDRQVKVRGMRIELDGVEATLRRHPGVSDAGVIARTDADGNKQLVAYVEWRTPASGAPSQGSLAELKEEMRRTLPAHMVPSQFYSLAKLPRLPTSKLDTRALSAFDAANRLADTVQVSETKRAEKELGAPHALNDVVARTWKRVLQVARLDPEDDFFDLGGDSLRAIALVAALEKALGRKIPLTLINQASTLAAFSAALVAAEMDPYSPLVTIKEGNGMPPLFLFHGAGGSAMKLFALGRSMRWSGAVIGIQARDPAPHTSSYRTVETMAGEYFAAIKRRQPNGPYLLCGFSFGGYLAVEVARRLREVGDVVAFVGLLDTLAPRHHFIRVWTWVAYLWRAIVRHVSTEGRRAGSSEAAGFTVLRRRLKMFNAFRASLAYRPKPYAGALTLFEATRRDLGVPAPSKYWKTYAETVHTRALEGRHSEFLSSCAAKTAQALTECLMNAMGQKM